MNSLNTIGHNRTKKDIADAKKLEKETNIYICPEENNMYSIHFVMKHIKDDTYNQGIYYGLMKLSESHPFKPMSIYMLSPSGRFTVSDYPLNEHDKGICFTYTNYHEEQWVAILSVSSLLIAFQSFFLDNTTDKEGAGVGTIVRSPEIRKKIARMTPLYLLQNNSFLEYFPEMVPELQQLVQDRKLSEKELIHPDKI